MFQWIQPKAKTRLITSALSILSDLDCHPLDPTVWHVSMKGFYKFLFYRFYISLRANLFYVWAKHQSQVYLESHFLKLRNVQIIISIPTLMCCFLCSLSLQHPVTWQPSKEGDHLIGRITLSKRSAMPREAGSLLGLKVRATLSF